MKKLSCQVRRLMMLILVVGGIFAFTGAACDRKKDVVPVDEPVDPKAKNEDAQGQGFTHEARKVEDIGGPPAPAILYLSGLKGYTEPCGCTLDVMQGGIDRLVRYRDESMKIYPAAAMVMSGDIFFEHLEFREQDIPQERAKADVIAAGLKRLAPIFVVPGPRDLALGLYTYKELLEKANVTPAAINLSLEGVEMGPSMRKDLDGLSVAFIPVVNPELFEKIEAAKATDPGQALEKALSAHADADVRVLIVQGDGAFTRNLLADHPIADFAFAGDAPTETDQVYSVGDAHALEAYDQGRYFGVLKLYGGQGRFQNASAASQGELEAMERQITHVEDSIERLPPATPGNEPPILLNLRRRLEDLRQRRVELLTRQVAIPEGQNAFVWLPVSMDPGFPVDAEMEEARRQFNRSLEALAMQVEREIVPVEAGQAFYIGNQECALCHAEAQTFWEATAHAKAWETLVVRDKHFDQNCVSCHVVGYEKPGGSVLGKYEYTAELIIAEGSPPIEIHKNLKDVGCESCHGPGSLHRAMPIGRDGMAQHIHKGSGEKVCLECHVPEHSPRFNYDVFVRQITGDGHKLSE